MNKQPIFILGLPRSGTTLLQRILNSYDDVLIWGEHHGFLGPVAKAYYWVLEGRPWDTSSHLMAQPRVDWRSLSADKTNTSYQLWMNWFRGEEWKESFERFMDTLFLPQGLPGKRFWGFKEVSYDGDGRVIEFLKTLYPNAIFVFVIRNGFNVLASHWKTRVGSGMRTDLRACRELCARWKTQNKHFWQWHRSEKIRSFWISYEELIQGKGEVNSLLEHMGKSFGKNQRDVLASSAGRGSSFDNESYNDRWRTAPWDWLAVTHAMLGEMNRKMGFANPPVPGPMGAFGRAVIWFLSLVQFKRDSFILAKSLFKAKETWNP